MDAGPALSAFVTSIVFTSLSFVIVVLRLYTRIVVALLFCKLSIIFSYLREFKVAKTQKVCKAMLAILAVYGAWTVFGSVFMCVPVSAFWNDGTEKCMDRLAFWFSNAALNIATDMVIFAIPIPLIRSLQISRKQKIALIMVFAVGGL